MRRIYWTLSLSFVSTNCSPFCKSVPSSKISSVSMSFSSATALSFRWKCARKLSPPKWNSCWRLWKWCTLSRSFMGTSNRVTSCGVPLSRRTFSLTSDFLESSKRTLAKWLWRTSLELTRNAAMRWKRYSESTNMDTLTFTTTISTVSVIWLKIKK